MLYCIGNRKDRLCKIGYTARSIEERLKELRYATRKDIVCLGTLTGLRPEEKALHKKFESANLHGEWFTLTDEIAATFGFDINEPEKLWAVYLKYVDNRPLDGAAYLTFMRPAAAPTAAEAVVLAKEAAANKDKRVVGAFLLDEIAMLVPSSYVEQAYLTSHSVA